MGSSGGGTPRAPNMPVPPGQVPYGQTSPLQPQYQSFLPTDPTAMATGLTPEMLAGINAPSAPPPVQQAAAAAPIAAAGWKPTTVEQMIGVAMGGDPRRFGMPEDEYKQQRNRALLATFMGNMRGGGSGGGSRGGGYTTSGRGGFGGSSKSGRLA